MQKESNHRCDAGNGLQTRPKVITDSQALREILSGELYGKAEGYDERLYQPGM